MGSHRKQRGGGLPPLLARHKISVGKQTTSITISTRHERQAWWSRHNVDPPLGFSDACVAFFEYQKLTEFRLQSEGTRLSRVKSTSRFKTRMLTIELLLFSFSFLFSPILTILSSEFATHVLQRIWLLFIQIFAIIRRVERKSRNRNFFSVI